jgi:hypothetical protein
MTHQMTMACLPPFLECMLHVPSWSMIFWTLKNRENWERSGHFSSGVVFSGIFSHHVMLFKVWLSAVLGLFLIMLSRWQQSHSATCPIIRHWIGSTVESGAEVGLATHSWSPRTGCFSDKLVYLCRCVLYLFIQDSWVTVIFWDVHTLYDLWFSSLFVLNF